jgi:REP element-mobilizing transposase RayT
VLAQPSVASILAESWQVAESLYKWLVGRYVIMPDHVHFFASPQGDEAKSLSGFVGGWKRWTQREIRKARVESFAWQAEFFDHLLRSDESYESKWGYVRGNPVRAQLVADHDEWPFQGEINVLAW